MVAAAGGEGALEPRRAWSWLAVFLVLLAALSALAPYATDLGLAPMKKSPDVLRERARAIVHRFGYTDAAKDETSWLERDYPIIRWLADHLDSTDWRRRLSVIGSPVRFHYRRGPKSMAAVGFTGAVTSNDPPFDTPGAMQVVLDAEGRLREIKVIPLQWVKTLSTVTTVPVEPVFEEAGLVLSRFQPVSPEWVPPVAFDERREWTGTRADLPELPLRVSVASFGGRVTSMAVLGPWSRDAVSVEGTGLSRKIQQATLVGFLMLTLGAGSVFALRNVRAGRGDRRGAFRLALVVAVLFLCGWLARMHPAGEVAVLVLFQGLEAMGEALWEGFLAGVLYLALEPYVRRRMPELLVGWARLLEGRVSDPKVGRDILLGCGIGAGMASVFYVVNGLPTFIPVHAQTPIPSFSAGVALANRLVPLAAIPSTAGESLVRALAGLVFLFVCRLFLSRPWRANLVVGLLFALLALGGENPALETPGAVLTALLLTYALTQQGLLATVATWLVFLIATSTVPMGVGLTEWYAPYIVGTMALLIGVVAWSFHVSLGGRPAFGSLSVDA